ncbi:unnamed protein product [Oppiella nova]|uniref:Kinesin-associated microtubule-binding domain-containing protein n=1 Tax=Oppiella nova TaxID=334625 RepID=A0A7R9LMP8_9ACAR|nr:unnamed protein product [Oppiella nova]CAG2165078.1 unnamed protein product [Oppiella nova]
MDDIQEDQSEPTSGPSTGSDANICDLESQAFDAKTSLLWDTDQVMIPVAGAKIFNNIDEYFQKSFGKSKAFKHLPSVRDTTHEPPIKRTLVFEPSVSTHKRRELQTVLTKMKTTAAKGPNGLLLKCLNNRIKVLIRRRKSVKLFSEEIERLRRDLLAAREKNGIYVNEENFRQMEQQIKDQMIDIEEKIAQINGLHEEMNQIQQLFDETKEELNTKATELEVTTKTLDKTSHALKETKSDLHLTRVDRDEQKHLVGVHVNTEKVLSTQAKELLSVAEVTTSDVHKLHSKVDRLNNVESNNWTKTNEFQEKFMTDMNRLEELVSITTTSYNDSLEEMKAAINEKTSATEAVVTDTQNKITSLTDLTAQQMTRLSSIFQKDRLVLEQTITLKDNSSEMWSFLCQTFNEILSEVKTNQTNISEGIEKLNGIIAKQREDVEELVMKQNTHLKNISKITVNSLNNIKTDLKTTFESQSTKLTSLMEQMERSDHANNKLQEDLDQEMQQLIESIHNFNANRIKTRVNHQNSSSELNTKLMETKKNSTNCFQDLSSKVDGYVSQIQMEEKIALKYVESVDNLNTENTQQLMDQTNEVNVKNTELPNQIQELITTRKETTSEKFSHFNHLIVDSINSCDKQMSAKQSALKEMSDCLNEGLSEQKSFVVNIVENVKHITECVSEKTSEMSRMSETMEKSQIRAIESRYKSFEAFVKNDLTKDIPTGTTPQKTDYSYPRDLQQTSPHERILERFRLNSAANTSLPEENESEFLSDSNSSAKSFGSNDENAKPLTDTQKRRKPGFQSKSKSNSSLKKISESEQTFSVSDTEPQKRTIVTPKPLTANRNN